MTFCTACGTDYLVGTLLNSDLHDVGDLRRAGTQCGATARDRDSARYLTRLVGCRCLARVPGVG